MAQLVVPNGVLVRLVWALGGQPYAVNVLGARKAGATTIDQGFANTLGAAIKAAATSAALLPMMHTTVGLQKVGVRDISAPNLPEFLDAGASVLGTATDKLLPPQIALCATLRTARAGKSFRGRFYQPGFTALNLTAGGAVTASVDVAIVNWLTAIKTAMSSSSLTMAIVSRKNASTEDVTLIQVRDLVFDTIRGRARPGI